MGNYAQDNKQKPQQSPKNSYQALNEEDYVKRAEQVIKNLSGAGRTLLATNQIRNILSMVNQLYNDVIMTTDEILSDNVRSQLKYLKVKLVYAAGRHKEVKAFVEESQIADHLDHIGNSRKGFILYAHYMEALVAYHRFYGGRD